MSCLVVSSTAMGAQLLAGLLAQCCPVAIAGACDSASAAIAAIDRDHPDLVIVDRDGNGDDCERIAQHLLDRSACIRLILYSPDPRLDPVLRTRAPIIERAESWQALLHCVRGRNEASRDQAELVDPLPDVTCFERLRPRERSVLELVGLGLGSRDIALTLGVSLQTVETYRKNVSAKLGVSGARLVRIAVLYSCVYPGRMHCPSKVRHDDGNMRPRTVLDVWDSSDRQAVDPALAHQA